MSPKSHHDAFLNACASGDRDQTEALLIADPALVNLRKTDAYGSTGLHIAAAAGHAAIVRLLLQHGADPNARETGDNATPLHFAAGKGHTEVARTLIDAGADVHASGDEHIQDVIGWATGWGAPEQIHHDVIALLLHHGARHHIFSAITLGDLDLIRSVVTHDPQALSRRMSRFEQGQSPLHFAINQKRNDITGLLIELGADLEAVDDSGKTPLALAMLRGDREAISLLRKKGAKPPLPPEPPPPGVTMQTLAGSVGKQVTMISVPDVAATLDWYKSIGFRELARYGDGTVNFGSLAYGAAELMLTIGGAPATGGVSLWFYTSEVDNLYKVLRSTEPAVEFTEDIYNAFYGARQFGIRDRNGYNLYFIQPDQR